ncbi:MAG: hypothetical protein ACFE9Q_08865 [Candidatus Hodarchaeota archaeon]
MDLTPKRIYEELGNSKINKFRAYDILISLIENSESEEIRISAIKYLEKIEVNPEHLFNLLENLLISDSNSEIRNRAAKFLKNSFLEKSFNTFKWVIKHETDYECLIIAIRSLEEINSNESKLILINEIKKITRIKILNKERKTENKKFKKVIKKFIKTKKLINFTHTELGEILINYLTIFNLINQYPNVYYELDPQNGLIRELDLSDYMEYEVKGTPFGWKNNIQSIKEIIGLKYLKKLKKIDLSNNLITDAKDLLNLKELTHLILRNNKIIEKENLNYFKRLSNLEFLDLRGNELAKKIKLNEFDPKINVLLTDSHISIN